MEAPLTREDALKLKGSHMHEIFGIIGIINLGSSNYLVVVSQIEEAATW